MTDWTDCHFLRPIGSRSCVIRLDQTGAILQITLQDALDVAQACLACPAKPVPARVHLAGDLDHGLSELEIEWPAGGSSREMLMMPPPARFIRKSRTVPRRTKPKNHD